MQCTKVITWICKCFGSFTLQRQLQWRPILRALREIYFLIIFFGLFSYPVSLCPHVNLYLSCLYRRDLKISFYIWDMSLACNYITNGNEDRFWALVIKFRLFLQCSSKNTVISTTSSALYQRNAGFLLGSLLSNRGTALSRVAACLVMTTCYQSHSSEIFHYYKDVSSCGNIWVGATQAFQPHSCLAESIAACCAGETLCKECWNRGAFCADALRMWTCIPAFRTKMGV